MRSPYPPGEDEVRAVVSERLRRRRKAAGLTQERLAHAAFLHPKYVGAIERRTHTPTLWTLAKLAWALGLEPHDFLRDLPTPDLYPTRPAPT